MMNNLNMGIPNGGMQMMDPNIYNTQANPYAGAYGMGVYPNGGITPQNYDLSGNIFVGNKAYANFADAYGATNVNDQAVKINPNVLALISPIIETMTQYDSFQKFRPAFGMWNPQNSLSDYDKKKFENTKKQCVHLIRDVSGGGLIPTLEEFDDTKFKCRLCGRFVYKEFNKKAVEKLQEAISVLNMVAFFGMTLNITPEHMSKIIFLKEIIPDAIQLVDILNTFVNEENKAISSEANIGEASRNAEFRPGNMLNFGI